jgi:hypothetical protein
VVLKAFLSSKPLAQVKRPWLVQLFYPWAHYFLGLQMLASSAALLFILYADLGQTTFPAPVFGKIVLTAVAFGGIVAPIGMVLEKWWGYLLEFALAAPVLVFMWFSENRSKPAKHEIVSGFSSALGVMEWIGAVVLVGYCLVHGVTLICLEIAEKRRARLTAPASTDATSETVRSAT